MTNKNHKIVSLKVANIMKIKTAEVKPSARGLVVVGGKNGNGKTSLMGSIAMALGGANAIPKEPIRHGEERAEIILELEDLTITRVFTEKQSYLKVTTSDGASYPSPQKMLERLYSGLTFDALAFSRMDERKQADILRKIAGLDFTEHDAKRAALYETRRDANRDHKALVAQLASAPVHDKNAVASSVDGLVSELEAADRDNDKRRALVGVRDECERKNEADNEEIAILKSRIETLHVGVTGRLEFLADPKNKVPEPLDTEPIRACIRDAEKNNQHVRENQVHERLTGEVKDAERKKDELAADITNLDIKKSQEIRDAKLPIDGLTIEENGIRYGGVLFAQCSSANQLRVSVAMGIAMNPELRILLIRDGSLLDDDNLKMIADMAEAADVQVWIERVGEGEECTVIMEDGSIKESA